MLMSDQVFYGQPSPLARCGGAWGSAAPHQEERKMSLQESVEGDVGAVPRCKACGSERVVRDALACWNAETGLWELEQLRNTYQCQACNDPAELVWERTKQLQSQKIRELNDRLRCEGKGRGSIMITSGIQELGGERVSEVLAAIRGQTEFTEDNDPWGEHDFGALQLHGEKIFWKIDYYNPDCSAGSENPANEALTHRVLTVMLAREY